MLQKTKADLAVARAAAKSQDQGQEKAEKGSPQPPDAYNLRDESPFAEVAKSKPMASGSTILSPSAVGYMIHGSLSDPNFDDGLADLLLARAKHHVDTGRLTLVIELMRLAESLRDQNSTYA